MKNELNFAWKGTFLVSISAKKFDISFTKSCFFLYLTKQSEVFHWTISEWKHLQTHYNYRPSYIAPHLSLRLPSEITRIHVYTFFHTTEKLWISIKILNANQIVASIQLSRGALFYENCYKMFLSHVW